MANRRAFLRCLGAAPFGALATACTPATPALPPGELLGPSPALGHRLRAPDFPPPGEMRHTDVLIIGAGIAGLSVTRELRRAGLEDFLLLDMENEAGGNSRAGRSEVTAYPWGAHYLPLPGSEGEAVRELLAELGVLHGPADAARPVYDERFLCAAPQERLYRNGRWEEGLLPQFGSDAPAREQHQRFQAHMARLKHQRGRDGRRVFALPVARASRDPAWRALDRITLRDWLLGEGYTDPGLHWLANYACRDDYGTAHHETSAWAGLHYFACRDGEAANTPGDAVLTAPEGNAWLARGLARGLDTRLLTGALCIGIEAQKQAIQADVFFPAGGRTVRFTARQLVWAAPLHALPRVWRNAPGIVRAACTGTYAPWLVANLHLARPPAERHGAPLAWDNVLHDSPSLGYVVATHQQLRRDSGGPTVFTYYRALHELAPAAGRERLLTTPQAAWADTILRDLETAHPDIRAVTTRLDIWRHGHAMHRPVPGSLWGGPREALAGWQDGRLHLAHSDLSGISLFEEAFDRGRRAADRLLRRAGLPAVRRLDG